MSTAERQTHLLKTAARAAKMITMMEKGLLTKKLKIRRIGTLPIPRCGNRFEN